MIVRFVDIDGIVDHYCFRRYKQSTIFHNNYLHVISAVLLNCHFLSISTKRTIISKFLYKEPIISQYLFQMKSNEVCLFIKA
jgi:hypothetical protein